LESGLFAVVRESEPRNATVNGVLSQVPYLQSCGDLEAAVSGQATEKWAGFDACAIERYITLMTGD